MSANDIEILRQLLADLESPQCVELREVVTEEEREALRRLIKRFDDFEKKEK